MELIINIGIINETRFTCDHWRLRFSHSDLEADDEEFDSLNQSDSVNQSDHGNHEPQTSVNATVRPRLPTPTGDNPHEVSH